MIIIFIPGVCVAKASCAQEKGVAHKHKAHSQEEEDYGCHHRRSWWWMRLGHRHHHVWKRLKLPNQREALVGRESLGLWTQD